jgi:hypothetical protein
VSSKENIAELGKKTRFSKKNQPKSPGRRPNRFAHLKDTYELSSQDVGNLIGKLLSLKLSELNKIILDKDTTMLEKAFARAVKEAAQKGTLYQVEQMLNRKIGKVPNNVDITTGGDKIDNTFKIIKKK